MTVFPHQDHLGSSIAETGLSGAVNWRESYAAYGGKRLDPVMNRDDEGFTDHIDDAASGLTYMQARYYDPVIGRFLSNDPVGFAPTRPQYFNRYAYAGNDPVNMIDPDGEAAVVVAVPYIVGAIACLFACDDVVEAATGQSDGTIFGDTVFNGTSDQSGTLPDSIFDRKAPGQRTPAGSETIDHGRYNPATGEYEESEVEYYEYGRQIRRTDKTDHGYPDAHDNPHEHEYEYGPGYAPDGRETRSDRREPENDPPEPE